MIRPQSVELRRSKQTRISPMMSIALNPLVLLLCLGSLCVLFHSIEARSRPFIDDRIVFPKDSEEEGSSSKFPTLPSANSTTTEVPSTTRSTPSSTTNTSHLNSTESEELTETEKPVIDNRILIETSPKCKEGFELRANRCRKSA